MTTDFLCKVIKEFFRCVLQLLTPQMQAFFLRGYHQKERICCDFIQVNDIMGLIQSIQSYTNVQKGKLLGLFTKSQYGVRKCWEVYGIVKEIKQNQFLPKQFNQTQLQILLKLNTLILAEKRFSYGNETAQHQNEFINLTCLSNFSTFIFNYIQFNLTF